MRKKGTLIFFCGKMGSGKSTKSLELARAPETILVSEDEWLSTIYPEEIKNFEDYLKYSSRLKPLVKKHVRDILNSGVSVVMDFPGNTKAQRAWFKDIYSEDNIPHKLIYLEVDDLQCLKQLEKRRRTHPERARFDTEEVFQQVNSYFQPPSKTEEFNIEIVNSPVGTIGET
ncbi:MAG TPA: ATP-binding protein [Gammaproteobacteria bacterium]